MRTKPPKTIVLSIDPGYDRVGWAIGETRGSNYSLITSECIQTNRKLDVFARYQQITAGLEEILKTYSPTEAAVETLFFSVNRKTAMRVSEARGVIISSLLNSGLEIFEYNPGEIKLAITGYGRADKQAVTKMVQMQTGQDHGKLLDDAIDAIAIGMTHALTLKLKQTKATLNKAAAS